LQFQTLRHAPAQHPRGVETRWAIPGLAEPVIGPRVARTRWLARDDIFDVI
jgi:hypothetical protein